MDLYRFFQVQGIHVLILRKMRILADIGHPKNAHIMGKLAPVLQARGHDVHFCYRERERIGELCRALGLRGESRGRGGEGRLGKLAYLIKADLHLFRLARSLKPDLLLSFGSPYLAHVAGMCRIPMVVFDDTEENPIVQRIYLRSASAVAVPECFRKEFAFPMQRFAGYYELAYLHPRRFLPDASIRSGLGLGPADRLILLRIVAWRALHDLGHDGIGAAGLNRVVEELSKKARVVISAEDHLPSELEPLRLAVPPEKIHHVMAAASLVFSEGATMAAEGAVLGVPTVHVSDLRPGYLSDLEGRYGLLQSYPRCDLRGALETAGSFLSAGNEIRNEWQKRRERMLAESADVIEFMVKTIEAFDQGGR